MTVLSEFDYAVLAMDSYNRDNNQQVTTADGFLSANGAIGDLQILFTLSDLTPSGVDDEHDFYAVA